MLSISGAVPPLPLNAFIVCVGKTLPTSFTECSKTLCAPDDYNTKARKNILNGFNHLP
jgi:hypothetical protein